jgi:hypothetical protein
MNNKTKNTGNFPYFNKSKSLKPKGGLLPIEIGKNVERASGKELGFLAFSAKTKTAEALLEFSYYVYSAYSRFYEPWKKVGRKGSKRIKEALEADRNWEEFLKEMGWEDFKRHQKQIRQFALIGRKAKVLDSVVTELPNTVSTLAVICKSVDDDKTLKKIAKQCSSDTTAKEARLLIKEHTNKGKETEVEEGEFVEVMKADFVFSLENLEANAAVIALIEKLELFNDCFGENVTVESINDVQPELYQTIQKFLNSDQLSKLVELYDNLLKDSDFHNAIVAQHEHHWNEVRDQIRKSNVNNDKKTKRDFSKLKV